MSYRHSSCHCFEIGPVYTCSFFTNFILFYFRPGQNNVVLEMNGSPFVCKFIVPCNLMAHLQRCCHSLVCWPENYRSFIWWLHNLIYWLLGHWCYKLHFLSHHHMAKSELYIFVLPPDLDHSPVSKARFATNIFHLISSKN